MKEHDNTSHFKLEVSGNGGEFASFCLYAWKNIFFTNMEIVLFLLYPDCFFPLCSNIEQTMVLERGVLLPERLLGRHSPLDTQDSRR